MSTRLTAAMRERRLIRLTRAMKPGYFLGYVIDIGPKFCVMAMVTDQLWLDGYRCFRIADIAAIEHDPHASFVETVLWVRHEIRAEASPVSLASVADLLRSAAAAFPLMILHTELTDPHCYWVGRLMSVDRRRALVREVSPDAIWVAEPSEFLLRDITQIGFGGDYEDALMIANGYGLPASDRILRSIESPDGCERVLIVRRSDGVYSYRKQFLSPYAITDPDSPLLPAGAVQDGAWTPPGPYCGLYDSPMTAEQEAVGRGSWLSAPEKPAED